MVKHLICRRTISRIDLEAAHHDVNHVAHRSFVRSGQSRRGDGRDRGRAGRGGLGAESELGAGARQEPVDRFVG